MPDDGHCRNQTCLPTLADSLKHPGATHFYSHYNLIGVHLWRSPASKLDPWTPQPAAQPSPPAPCSHITPTYHASPAGGTQQATPIPHVSYVTRAAAPGHTWSHLFSTTTCGREQYSGLYMRSSSRTCSQQELEGR